MDRKWESLGMPLHCFGCAVQNCGRTFHMFHEEDIAKLLPKYIAGTARITTQQTTSAIWRIF